MFSYIKGTIADIEEDLLVLEANQIGYQIRIPMTTLDKLPGIGQEIKIFTYMHVREDAISLFGFLTKDDLRIFRLLIGVNGIGPKGGLGILSTLSGDNLRFAVLSDDAKTLAKCQGIGKKTAQRIILDLKDKLKVEDAFAESIENPKESLPILDKNDPKQEAVLALTSLGYSNAEALKAVKQSKITEDMDSEQILKAALKNLSFL